MLLIMSPTRDDGELMLLTRKSSAKVRIFSEIEYAVIWKCIY